MTRLAKYRYETPDFDAITDWRERFEAELKWEDELRASSDALEPGDIVGFLVTIPYADGAAKYVVTSANPLTLTWVAVGDAWAVPEYQIRGLRKADIIGMQERQRALAELFGRKEAG